MKLPLQRGLVLAHACRTKEEEMAKFYGLSQQERQVIYASDRKAHKYVHALVDDLVLRIFSACFPDFLKIGKAFGSSTSFTVNSICWILGIDIV